MWRQVSACVPQSWFLLKRYEFGGFRGTYRIVVRRDDADLMFLTNKKLSCRSGFYIKVARHRPLKYMLISAIIRLGAIVDAEGYKYNGKIGVSFPGCFKNNTTSAQPSSLQYKTPYFIP